MCSTWIPPLSFLTVPTNRVPYPYSSSRSVIASSVVGRAGRRPFPAVADPLRGVSRLLTGDCLPAPDEGDDLLGLVGLRRKHLRVHDARPTLLLQLLVPLQELLGLLLGAQPAAQCHRAQRERDVVALVPVRVVLLGPVRLFVGDVHRGVLRENLQVLDQPSNRSDVCQVEPPPSLPPSRPPPYRHVRC